MQDQPTDMNCATTCVAVCTTCVLAIIAVALMLILTLHYDTTAPNQHFIYQQNKIDIDIYGQEREQMCLMDKIMSKRHIVIEIVGAVGVGKTAFVLNTTDKLVRNYNYCSVYIDVPVDISSDVSSMIVRKIQQEECMDTQQGWRNTFISASSKVWYLLQSSYQLFRCWYNKLQSNTILIFDHADKKLNEIEKEVIEPLSTLNLKSVTVLLVSRVTNRHHLKRPIIPLVGLEPSQCIHWITSKYKQVTFDKSAEELCNQFGGVPSDVIDAVELVKSPYSSQSLHDFLKGVSNPEYGMGFKYLESILGRHYKDTKERNIAMYVQYNRLDYEQRECIWLLVEITESGEFTKEMAEKHLEVNVDSCIDSLLMNSLLQTEQIPNKKFRFRPNIRRFIQSIGQPTPYVDDVRTKVWMFYGNYVKYNVRNLYEKLKTTHDLQLAIDIGSDRELVNSFVPLLGEKDNRSREEKFDLRPLFKIALDVIEEYYCSSVSLYKSSNAKALLAFSYLTKAVHCPLIHPPAMLSSQWKLISKPDMCLKKLKHCPAVLSMRNNTYEAAEALGYYNSLLIYAYNGSVSWSLSFIDVSMIVTVANRECGKFCKWDGFCQCPKASSIQHGLRQFLLRNYNVSEKYFHSTLYQLSGDNQPCQTILKVIAIIGIYSGKQDAQYDSNIHLHQLMNIDFNNLNISCFLGVLNDLIIPYLIDVEHKDSQNLIRKMNKLVSEDEEQCDNESTTDEERLDCMPKIRYTIAHGLTALKMIKLQETLRWPQEATEYASTEEWVCSIIRDKTTKCKEALPLFSTVRAIETNDNYKSLWAMQYFLEAVEYELLEKKARAIPRLFQLMSI